MLYMYHPSLLSSIIIRYQLLSSIINHYHLVSSILIHQQLLHPWLFSNNYHISGKRLHSELEVPTIFNFGKSTQSAIFAILT